MYFVTRVNFNTQGTQANSIQKFDDGKSAYKRYYSILGTDIDSETFAYELVQIVREDGIVIASQVIDNRETGVANG